MNKMSLMTAVLMMLINLTAQAESFNTEKIINISGKKGVLAADEGYLFLSLSSNTDISRITIDGIGFGNKFRFNDIKAGDNYALLKVKAGDYYWEHINIYVGIGHVRKQFQDDDYAFTVQPGVINYPGSWKFFAKWVPNGRVSIDLENYNHLSFEMLHFKNLHPTVASAHPFKYQGQVEDPYGDFLSKALANSKTKPLPDLLYERQDEANLPMTMLGKDSPTNFYELAHPTLKKYFSDDFQRIRSVSPDGDYFLFDATLDDVVTVGLIEVESYRTYILYQQKLPANTTVTDLDWVDHNSFFLTLSNSGKSISYVAHLDIEKQANTIAAKYIKIRAEGYLLDGLQEQENQLLFVQDWAPGMRQKNNLYLLDVTDEPSIDDSLKKIHKPTRKLEGVVDWLVDGQGVVRAAITVKYDHKTESMTVNYWFLADPKSTDWKKVRTVVDSDHMFWLKGLSADESHFVVLTNEFSDKQAIHKYSTSDGSHLGEIYHDDAHDIRDVMYDSLSGELMGYVYVEEGMHQVHYFKDVDQSLLNASQSNQDLTLFQVLDLPAKNRTLLYGLTPNSKGAWYMLNTETGRSDKVFDSAPDYEALPKGQHHVLKVKADDGVEIEGFLVMPTQKTDGKVPLLVMPHGGPIGVQDFANNNAMQHYLATQGLATLKVNYRGSGGYGKAFEALGKQQWGEKIEADIQAVTQQALAEFNLDAQRVCAMGGSYGGYSALMLTYLYPETYQCAISFAGVMDLPLMFTSRDLSRDSHTQSMMTEIVGNPKTEIDKLVDKSPLYQLANMQKPMLLFHGLQDERVRPEHAIRMQQLFSLYGMDHEVVLFKDEGHGFSHENTVVIYLAKSLMFLKKHLSH